MNFEVASVGDEQPGANDEMALARSVAEDLILLTLDKDFGTLVFSEKHQSQGVILFRLDAESPDDFARIALEALRWRDDWPGHFSVVTRDRIRMTPAPFSS